MSYIQANMTALRLKLNEFRSNDEFCDVSIHVGDTFFKCHRLILAAASEYFYTMFSGNYKESKEEVVTLANIDAPAFREVLRFAYTGDVVITPENASSLLIASDLLGLSSVEEFCVECIEQNIPIQNAVDLFVFARRREKNSLMAVLSEYIKTHFYSFSNSDKFLELSLDDFRSLLRLPCARMNENLCVDAIIRWVFHAREERVTYSRELVDTVNFKHITLNYVEFMMKKYLFAFSTEVCFNELADYHPTKPLTLHVFLRFKEQQQGTIFSMKKHVKNWKCTSTSISNQIVAPTATMVAIQSTAFDNRLYSLSYCYDTDFDGGRIYEQTFFVAPSIDLSTDIQLLTSPPKFVSKFQICTLQDSIYLYDRNASTKVRLNENRFINLNFGLEQLRRGIYAYNRELDQWFPVPPLKTLLENACVTADNNRIYMVGGNIEGESKQGYFQAYDSRISQWLELPKSANKYVNAACCIHEGKIYVSGGHSSGTSNGSRSRRYVHGCRDDVDWDCKTEVFDPTAGKWQQIEPMIAKRHLHKLVSYQDRLWAIGYGSTNNGGITSTDVGNFIEVYDTLLQKWSIVVNYAQDMSATWNHSSLEMFQDAIVFESLE